VNASFDPDAKAFPEEGLAPGLAKKRKAGDAVFPAHRGKTSCSTFQGRVVLLSEAGGL
jgi:hypothetical protein